MEPIGSVERINVLVISDSGNNTNLFHLAADTTISKVKRLWEAEHELPEGSVVRKTDGSRLEDGEQISDIEEVSPGSKTVIVLIEKAINLHAGVHKCSVEAAAAVGGGGEVTDSPFYVNDFVRVKRGGHFSVVLRLPGRPTVGDVRRAITHHMDRPELELVRWIGRTKSGEEVFHVGRDFPLVFADVSGEKKREREVKEMEHRNLHDDDQPFPIVAGHENRIFVYPRLQP